MAETRVGISGWRYGPWREKFYPPKLPQKRELEFASRCLNSIEINGSFYSLQRPTSYERWYEETPDDFVFSVKGGRYITHIRRLREVEDAMANFMASGVLRLREKLGPILWQFPPQMKFDPELFEKFLEMLPHDMGEAAKLAARHTAFLKGRSWTKVTDKSQPVRHAMEIRHESFETEEFVDLLRKHGVAIVVADTAGKWPYMEDVTADFIYARLHGDEELYVSGYGDEALDRWAKRFEAWRKGGEPADARRVGKKSKKLKSRDVFVYFDNDVKVYAPFDAMGLGRRLGIERDYEQVKGEAVLTGRTKQSRDTRGSAWRFGRGAGGAAAKPRRAKR
jgi:uncharacterized protein YecE (DUF72 family)